MDHRVIALLQDTTVSQGTQRKNAEAQLQELYHNQDFAPTLCTIAISGEAPVPLRQSALLVLKNLVLAGWSESFDEFKGQLLVNDANKSAVRETLLGLAIGEAAPRKIQSAASLVVSKIASVDYPDEWPDILTKLLHNISQAGPNSLHGSLKVLSELVEDGFDQDQFFAIAQDLSNVLHHVAVSDAALSSRALAIDVFRGCFDILEMVLEDHRTAVKQFAERIVGEWMPLLLHTTQSTLPERPSEVNGDDQYAGLVKLKIQVMKTLMRIRLLFPSLVSPQGQTLFQATWDDLLSTRDTFEQIYIQNDAESRLEDADGMPYTLDFLVVEELDFLRAIIGSPNVRKVLEAQLRDQNQRNWLVELLDVVVPYSQITTEEEGMWEIDVNVFLSEETSVTANYTARTACGDLATKIGEWLPDSLIQALITYMSHLFTQDAQWRKKEAVLCILGTVLEDWRTIQRKLDEAATRSLLEFTRVALEPHKDSFLKARGYWIASVLTATAKQEFLAAAGPLLEATIHTIASDEWEIVRVSCVRALGPYIETLPASTTYPQQQHILAALSNFLSTRDSSDLTESDELILTLLDTLRETLKIDVRSCVDGDGLNLLFQIAGTLSAGFTVIGSVNEAFEEICENVKALGDFVYAQFAARVVPNLLGAFNVGGITDQEALLTLAADMLSHLTSQATSTSLPPELVPSILPKVLPLLLTSEEPDILRPCTSSLKHILDVSPMILLSWHDSSPSGPESNPTAGKTALECVLLVIDRLLQPSIEESAATEVGYLASSLVAAAGSTQDLTPYLPQLLRAIAHRLHTATKPALSQSLIVVFARLCMNNASGVADFLASLPLPSQTGQEQSALQALIPKWLTSTPDFSGHDNIRTNILALTRLYDLHDPRLEAIGCQGEVIVPPEPQGGSRIMTRSMRKKIPVTYTRVGAGVKIVKVLAEELQGLQAANTNNRAELGLGSAMNGANGAANGDTLNELDDDDDDDGDFEDEDGEWEDDPGAGVLDLGLPGTKDYLMSLGADGGGGEEGEFRLREADDETQNFLVQWFGATASREGFAGIWEQLTEAERGILGFLR